MLTFAAARLGVLGLADVRASEATSAPATRSKPGAQSSFGPLKQIDAGLLNVGYAESGPADGPAAILLHGWPYDIHSFVEVTPLLAAAGYRVIVPYLRGYGTTRFLSNDTSGTVSHRHWPSISFITVPTITLEGDANGAPHPEPGAYAKKFTGKYSHRLIPGGIGHNLPQEAPHAFADAVIEVGS